MQDLEAFTVVKIQVEVFGVVVPYSVVVGILPQHLHGITIQKTLT